jgi:hypothetical protein
MVDVTPGAVDAIPPAEVAEVDLYHPHSWWTKYVFSQDAKVIAIQYGGTAVGIGMVALVLSWLMRLQLGFPGTFTFITPEAYYQFITMHGMIMVIYLLTALFLGGFGNYLIPLMVGARDMVFPYVNMLSYWIYLLAVLVLGLPKDQQKQATGITRQGEYLFAADIILFILCNFPDENIGYPAQTNGHHMRTHVNTIGKQGH